MIGIQGENVLEEVTKSPCDTSLDASSTNAVENRVVTQAINELNSDLTDNSVSSSKLTLSGNTIVKKNVNVVEVTIEGTATSDVTFGDTVATVSEEFRPSRTQRLLGISHSADQSIRNVEYFTINTDGTIKNVLGNTIPSGYLVNVVGSFII